MAGSVNKVILVGNVGRDPEVRSTQGGQKVVQLSIATSESWKDKQTGERQEKTEWHRVVIWNENIADVVERYVRKGTSVYVEGQLQTRKWTDEQSGQERYSTEVVIQKFKGELTLLGGRGEGAAEQPAAQPRGNGGGGSYRQDAPRGGGRQQPQRSSRIEDDLDDSIPF